MYVIINVKLILYFFSTVCVSFLQRFQDAAGDKVYDVEKSEAELMKFCKTARGKDESFVSIFIIHVHMVYNNKCLCIYHLYFTPSVIISELQKPQLQE